MAHRNKCYVKQNHKIAGITNCELATLPPTIAFTYFSTFISDQDKIFSKPLVCVRAHARAHVRVRRFLCKWVRKIFQKCACGCVGATLIFCKKNWFFSTKKLKKFFFLKIFLQKNVRVRAQKMACGCVRHTLQFLCDVRAGAGQKFRTLKVW